MNCRACRDPYVLCHIPCTTPLPLICPPAGSWFTLLLLGRNLQTESPEALWAALGGPCHPELLTSLETSPHLPQHLVSRTAVLGDFSKQLLTYYFRANAQGYIQNPERVKDVCAAPSPRLGSTCGGNSPYPVPHNCAVPDTAGVILFCGQHHAGKCLKIDQQIGSAEN